MNPAQILSLAFLAGLVPGYCAGAWCPWWLAGFPCYVAAFITYKVAKADPDHTPEQVGAYTTGMLMGGCAAASVVGWVCAEPHATGVLHGLDPCAAPLVVGLLYAVGVWADEMNPPAFPATRSQVAWAGFALYCFALGVGAWMRGAT